ncbi:phosphotransferase family protein [Timonella sp. A28]|uniref:phosphotransferase family protein n=1 Tax=Timonella sp. A28 TaxID=3442640 RepID=UPI003EBF5383
MTALDVSADQLANLVSPIGTIAHYARLTGGMFATTFKVTLTDGQVIVVKIAPAGDSSLLTYERNITKAELDIYQRCADKPALLMPSVIHWDFTRAHVEGDAIFVSHLDGTPWTTLIEDKKLGWDAERPALDRAHYFPLLHTVTSHTFGYPASPNLQGKTWREAFTNMWEALFADSARWDIRLPEALMREALAQHIHVFDDVTRAHLIHMDLWQGNMFLNSEHGLCGVIDTERALFGDPLFDFVGCDQLGEGPIPTDHAQAYMDTAQRIYQTAQHDAPSLNLGHVDLDIMHALASLDVPTHAPQAETLTSADIRILFYRCYIYALLLLEVGPRDYPQDWVIEHTEKMNRQLHAALNLLTGSYVPR